MEGLAVFAMSKQPVWDQIFLLVANRGLTVEPARIGFSYFWMLAELLIVRFLFFVSWLSMLIAGQEWTYFDGFRLLTAFCEFTKLLFCMVFN